MLNEKQTQAVKYYGGINVKEYPLYLKDPNSYNMINSLLFPGVTTENARIKEGRYLNPNFLSHPKFLREYYSLLLSCFKPSNSEFITYRVERLEDYNVMKKLNHLPSFISTSKNYFLNAYRNKIDLVLMIFHINKDTLIIDFNKEIKKYEKKEEQEVLLKVGTKIKIFERNLNEEERKIKDLNNNEPKIICDVYFELEKESESIKNLIPKKIKMDSMLYINDLNYHNINSKYIKSYLKYKKTIQEEIGIKYEENKIQ